MKRLVSLAAALLLLATALFSCGKGPEAPELSLSFSKQFASLDSLKSVQVIIAKPVLKGGAKLTCAALLDGKLEAPVEKLDIIKSKTSEVTATPFELIFSDVPTGEFVFLVNAFSTAIPSDTPIGIGCEQGKVDAGKKLQLSIMIFPSEKK